MKAKNRESRRRERRREAAFTIRSKTCCRKPLTSLDAAHLVAAIDKNDTSRFGIVKLSTMELNHLHSISVVWLRMPPRVSFIEYAVRRKRDMITVSDLVIIAVVCSLHHITNSETHTLCSRCFFALEQIQALVTRAFTQAGNAPARKTAQISIQHHMLVTI